MAGRVNPASLLSLDELFTTESERTSNKDEPQPESPKGTPRGSSEEPREHVSEQTVKKTFFLTQRNCDALKLHHMMYASSAREYSKIVNEALEAYLSDEIEALAEAEKKKAGNRKFVLALGRLSDKVSKGL